MKDKRIVRGGYSENQADILFMGNIRQQNQGLTGSVYNNLGICPTLRARDYKDPVLVFIENEDKIGKEKEG